jgi:GTP-binding protein Era
VGTEPAEQRSGFVALVGRPNTGKSTLTNALVGEKVAITSSRPQTTRRAIRGIVDRPGGQLVLVDTPGLHRPRTLLGERLNALVRESTAQVDVVAMCLPADEPVGPGDRHLAAELAGTPRTAKVAVVTKSDKVDRGRLATRLVEVSALAERAGFDWAVVVAVSAVRGEQVELLADLLLGLLPVGPRLYPDGEPTDEPADLRVAELVREAALEGVREELPHSIAVVVQEMGLRPDRPADRQLMDVHATIFVERDSQKAIVIGRRGERLREVGTRARHEIERLLGTPVYLDLHVTVAKDWQRDPRELRKLGF